MTSTNRFQGLHRGPIDHKSSSVINQVSDGAIDMGSVIALVAPVITSETLPRVEEITDAGSELVYGVAVGGDTDGIYGDGSVSVDDSTRATNGAGQGVVVVTQGRCLARVLGPVSIGNLLTQSGTSGVLDIADTDLDAVIAIALFDIPGTDTDMIAVDVQRGGVV